jgi:hypothetical protein
VLARYLREVEGLSAAPLEGAFVSVYGGEEGEAQPG